MDRCLQFFTSNYHFIDEDDKFDYLCAIQKLQFSFQIEWVTNRFVDCVQIVHVASSTIFYKNNSLEMSIFNLDLENVDGLQKKKY